jgi:hypothetical protein
VYQRRRYDNPGCARANDSAVANAMLSVVVNQFALVQIMYGSIDRPYSVYSRSQGKRAGLGNTDQNETSLVITQSAASTRPAVAGSVIALERVYV